MQPLLRPEYIDAALEKSINQAQAAELGRIRFQVTALNSFEAETLARCVENRINAGEDQKRTRAPASIQAASDRAAQDIHKVELRKCRRADTPTQIVESLLSLLSGDIEFNRSLLVHIDLPENLALSEALLVQKAQLQAEFEKFVSRWQSAA